MTILKRTIAGVPGAMVVTAGLGLLMAGLIKVEYDGNTEKPTQLTFIINEPPIDIEPRPLVEMPEFQDVEVPPPPPTIATDPSKLPKTEHVELKTEPPKLSPPSLRMDEVVFRQSDADASPLVRIPPIMPPRFAEGE